MITAYKHTQTQEIIASTLDDSSHQCQDPEEIEHLIDLYHLQEDFIRDPLDTEESSRVEYDEETGYSLIILDLPVVNDTNLNVLSFITIHLCIIIGNKKIFTVCNVENEFLEKFSHQNLNLHFHSRFALNILLTIANHYNRNLRLLNKTRLRIERDLKNNVTNKQLYNLMEVEKSLVYFLAALKGNGDCKKLLDYLQLNDLKKMKICWKI